MPAWMEKIKSTLSAKADLKSLFIELQPDNRVNSFMSVSYKPADPVSFPSYLDLTARIAREKEFIPDNLIIRFEGIPREEVPSSNDMLAKDAAEALRFIVSHGGITGKNTIPLRKVAYLQAQKKEVNKENLQALDHSQGYRQFQNYEETLEKKMAGKTARMYFTITETEQGVKIFNDGLSGKEKLRNYMQSLADNFFDRSLQNVESLNIYRIETSSDRMMELSNHPERPVPPSHPGLEILKNYNPSIIYDLRPDCENLERLIAANALDFSARNRDITILRDIIKGEYSPLLPDDSFPYRKEFASIDKEIREITRQRELVPGFPFEKKMGELQMAAGTLAWTLLNMEGVRRNRCQLPVRPAVIPPEERSEEEKGKPEAKKESKIKKETGKMNALHKKQVKPKL